MSESKYYTEKSFVVGKIGIISIEDFCPYNLFGNSYPYYQDCEVQYPVGEPKCMKCWDESCELYLQIKD